jgi:hypothetical protein
MIALRALDGPIYPSPRSASCDAYDAAGAQLDFIRAWVERLDDGGAGFSRQMVRRALADDPLYRHVEALARERAARLAIGVLPTQSSDEAAWLQANQEVLKRLTPAQARGLRCGHIGGLWGFEQPPP